MVSKKAPTIEELMEVGNAELEQSINKPSILAYKPYPEQLRFHSCDAFGRYISGGNRGGKTNSIVAEMIYWGTDTHPYLERPAIWGTGPLHQRCIVVDVEKGVNQIILPKLKELCPKSALINGSFEDSWDPKALVFTFANKSTIDFLTHGMTMDKHGGVPRHIVYFDEIPPIALFNEAMMRLVDYEGRWVISATSTEGMGWTYDFLVEPVEAGKIGPIELVLFVMEQDMNPYLAGTRQSRQRYYIAMSDEETAIRREGAFVARSGLVFPKFATATHVVEPFIPPRDWEWYSSVDFGWNNPTAWLWHAVSPEGDIVTFAEHYKSEMTVPDHAATVLLREAAWQRSPDVRVGDPAGNQHQMNTGTSAISEYAMRGVHILTEGIPKDVMIGIEKMQQYFALRRTGSRWGENRPKWVITSNCANFIRELKRLQWARYESSKMVYDRNRQEVVHKKNDHAFDSARYFATLMPNLAPMLPEPGDRVPTTISYEEMMMKLHEDESVIFVEEEETHWETQPIEEYEF